MKRLHLVNLFGVLALSVLCVVQWQRDRQLNLQVNRLEQTRLIQTTKLAGQEENVRGITADLTLFKERFTNVQTEAEAMRRKLAASERDARQLTIERDQLKTSVTGWAAAVTARDEGLREANAQIRRLTGELNDSIRKFNELATNHNAVVKDLNDLLDFGF